MATLAFKPYTYKPTAPRSKSTATHHRTVSEQVSILNKLQHITSDSSSFSSLRPVADDGAYRPETRGTNTLFGDSDKASNDETENDDRDLPTIEEVLSTNLSAQGFTAGDRGLDKTSEVKEVVADKRTVSVDQTRSAKSDILGRSLDDPIILPGDSNFGASEAEITDNALRAESISVPEAGLFDSPQTAIDSTTPALLCGSDMWYDIDDLLLAEQGAPTADARHSCTSTHLLSEPLHDSISAERLCYARSKATTSSSSPPSHYSRASSEAQLIQEDRPHTGQSVADGHGLVIHRLDTFSFDKRAREQQEAEEENGEYNNENKDERPQEGNNVASAVTAEGAGKSPRPAQGRQPLPNLALSPEPSYNKAVSRSDHNSDELNSSDSAGDDAKELYPAKRKLSSSSHNGPPRKKRRCPLQQSPPSQRRSFSEPYRQCPKSQSPLNQRFTVTTSSSGKGRLASLALSVPQATYRDMSPDSCNVYRSSGAALPTLTEVTFRPHSPHNCSFTAVIRDGCDGRGVSFSQVTRLIECIGHVGKIDDFTIKPMEQNLFLVTGFSRHTLSQPLPSGRALSTAEVGRFHRNKSRNRSQDGRPVDARSRTSRSRSSNSDDDDGMSDSDPESSGDDERCSSRGKQGLSSTSKHTRWDDIDEQRLLAYKKEDKSWDWIFKKFPGRTPAAIRTRWTMVQRRVKQASSHRWKQT